VTLHRYLREQGTTFERLLEDARRNLASRMLEQTDLPVGEIASALGYGTATSLRACLQALARRHARHGPDPPPGHRTPASPSRAAARR